MITRQTTTTDARSCSTRHVVQTETEPNPDMIPTPASRSSERKLLDAIHVRLPISS